MNEKLIYIGSHSVEFSQIGIDIFWWFLIFSPLVMVIVVVCGYYGGGLKVCRKSRRLDTTKAGYSVQMSNSSIMEVYK